MPFTRIAVPAALIGVASYEIMIELGYYPFICVISSIMAFMASGDIILNRITNRRK